MGMWRQGEDAGQNGHQMAALNSSLEPAPRDLGGRDNAAGSGEQIIQRLHRADGGRTEGFVQAQVRGLWMNSALVDGGARTLVSFFRGSRTEKGWL